MNRTREKDQTAHFFLIWLLGIAVVVLALFLFWHIGLPRHIEVTGHLTKLPQAAGDPQQEKAQRWVIDVEMPVKHVEHVQAARVGPDDHADLDVDILLTSMPTKRFRGKLAHDKIKAGPRLGLALGRVRIHAVDGDIPDDMCVPDNLLLEKTEVHARIRCR